MVKRLRFLAAGFAALLIVLCLGVTGCTVHARYYDPAYGDYHYWNNHETVYYQQWSVETHRDPHRDFRKLNKDEQNDYWKWRHEHPDNK